MCDNIATSCLSCMTAWVFGVAANSEPVSVSFQDICATRLLPARNISVAVRWDSAASNHRAVLEPHRSEPMSNVTAGVARAI